MSLDAVKDYNKLIDSIRSGSTAGLDAKLVGALREVVIARLNSVHLLQKEHSSMRAKLIKADQANYNASANGVIEVFKADLKIVEGFMKKQGWLRAQTFSR
jgi:transposase-like protein